MVIWFLCFFFQDSCRHRDLPVQTHSSPTRLSSYLAAGKACYIPLGHTVGKPADGGLDLDGATEAPKQIPRDDALAILKPMLEDPGALKVGRSEEHTSELQSLMRISYAGFCLKTTI